MDGNNCHERIYSYCTYVAGTKLALTVQMIFDFWSLAYSMCGTTTYCTCECDHTMPAPSVWFLQGLSCVGLQNLVHWNVNFTSTVSPNSAHGIQHKRYKIFHLFQLTTTKKTQMSTGFGGKFLSLRTLHIPQCTSTVKNVPGHPPGTPWYSVVPCVHTQGKATINCYFHTMAAYLVPINKQTNGK